MPRINPPIEPSENLMNATTKVNQDIANLDKFIKGNIIKEVKQTSFRNGFALATALAIIGFITYLNWK